MPDHRGLPHTDPDHDDRHDRGLLFDLTTLRERSILPPRMERRRALQLLGVGGVGVLLAACGSSGSSSSSASTTSSTSTTAAAGSATTTSSGSTVTEAIPEETGGPYPGDGSNGPNVLTESGIVRRDIRSSFGGSTGIAEGIVTTVTLTIVEAGSGDPIDGAAVYLWHCDREGRYSLYSQGVTDENYLRGVQAASADGTLSFTTVYPAAYSGRWPHMHFEVFPNLGSATSAGSKLVTSQLALPEDVSDDVYATDGYEQSVTNMARTSLTSDMVFRDGTDLQMVAVSGDVDSGFALSLTVAV